MIDTKYYSLLKVAETGSYTKAAKELALSQPAVSQHIRLLETELGIRIFERTRNQSRLTKEGKIVVKYVRRMVALQDHMKRDLKNEKEKITSLTIGITHTSESNVIVEVLADYVSMNDGMNLKIVTDSTDQLYYMLKNYELDFALVEGRINDASLNHILLDTDCLVLAVSPQHKLASRTGTPVTIMCSPSLAFSTLLLSTGADFRIHNCFPSRDTEGAVRLLLPARKAMMPAAPMTRISLAILPPAGPRCAISSGPLIRAAPASRMRKMEPMAPFSM